MVEKVKGGKGVYSADQAFAFAFIVLYQKMGKASVRTHNFLSSVEMQNVPPYFKESTPPHRRYILMKFLGSSKSCKNKKKWPFSGHIFPLVL